MKSETENASVWATSSESWDGFLNDPVLGTQLDAARRLAKARDSSSLTGSMIAEEGLSEAGQASIAARLQAYETPITDEILRQSIH